jgi:glucose-1-phosphate cytidylyltransferase
MQVMILAGGLGTRLAEETTTRPKPMVEIGERPILWHIMKLYSHYGFDDFFVALGYKGEFIKRYFADYFLTSSNVRMSLAKGEMRILDGDCEDWHVHLIDTGLATNTGGRLKQMQKYLAPETFMLTYGDGVCTVDLQALLDFHKSHGGIATVTAVHPPARFGGMDLNGSRVVKFAEKSQVREGWINGGFMVFEPAIFDYITGDQTVLESDVLERLADEGQLYAYQHGDFWQCMDTLRDKRYLEDLWTSGKAPWKLW